MMRSQHITADCAYFVIVEFIRLLQWEVICVKEKIMIDL
ncbi:hypothetical protein FHS45_003602 [Thalassobacillus devorans]|nr:hypothetical protein [Thalassobacillus devorans]